ncbi:MAG: ThuA domain-containing protein, partial [Saprospiraceae bacterium]|nr:ThuA domain-containing protein [Saprospiraceae bacterium]
VAQAPNLVFLQDTDGDDVMDKSRVLVKGFGIWDTHAGPANLKYGVDNMIWGSVGYSGFESTIGGVDISFKMGVFRFAKDGGYFEPIGQFNNNTWGLGFNENFEIFGSTANNNHACYVGIPLKHYDYLYKRPKWAINADFIQGHYDITAADTVPLQQVDVRGGYTAAAGANFYTARNYPAEYQNQMYVNEPTGHVVHLARIEQDGAGYKEVDGGNIFASTDSWTAPVYTETGPDGNLWVADWYNPVIQHNPDKRGMDNQIWNDNKGEGNAHLNEFRDLRHGRIYILKYKRAKKSPITAIDPEDDDALLTGIQSDNMFWRTTAQRLIVEGNKQQLIPKLLEIAADDNASDGAVLHTLWTLNALGAWGDEANTELLTKALGSSSYAVQRAAVALIPESEAGSNMLASSGLFTADHLQIRLAALLRATELPETDALYQAVEALAKVPSTSEDKWLSAALNVYYKTPNLTEVDPAKVSMIMSNDMPRKSIWSYTQEQPTDNWYATDFDDTNWKRGPAPFRGERAEKGETTWSTSDIWIRRDLTLKDDLDEAVLKIRNNEKYEVYVNGQLLFAEAGRNSEYKYIRLDEEQSALFKKGKNVIAAYCHKEKGNRLLDVQIGQITKPKADVVFNINTVNQKMAYDKTLLKAEAGQTVQIRLNNGDEMPHNLVVIKAGSLQNFGKVVDAFLQEPEAEEMDYVPNSRYVLSATPMLDPGESASIIFELPNLPGRYPFVCTFPGHWRAMQGEILVTAPGSYLAADPKATQVAVMGGGGSHDFLRFFGIADGKVLSDGGKNSVVYTEDGQHLKNILHEQDVLFLSNNQPFDRDTKSAILARAREGMGMMINHPSVWYNWTDWPQYNKEIVGGGSRSHEKFQEFEVKVVKPDHPIMKDVPAQFNIVDELYRWEQDETGTPVEVLAIGKSLETGEEYPVVWTVNHPDTKIVGNTLGHDEKAHNLKAYKTIIRNSIRWVKGEDQVDF